MNFISDKERVRAARKLLELQEERAARAAEKQNS